MAGARACVCVCVCSFLPFRSAPISSKTQPSVAVAVAMAEPCSMGQFGPPANPSSAVADQGKHDPCQHPLGTNQPVLKRVFFGDLRLQSAISLHAPRSIHRLMTSATVRLSFNNMIAQNCPLDAGSQTSLADDFRLFPTDCRSRDLDSPMAQWVCLTKAT